MRTRPPRSQIIAALVTDAVLQTRTPWNAYAAAVVKHYHATVALDERVVDFHVATTADNHDSCTRLNTQTVKRVLSGEIRMCVDIEESLLAAVPEQVRDHALTAVLAREDLLLARRPPAHDDASSCLVTPCALLRSAAAAVERVAPMLADGTGIGPEDAAHFAAAQQAISAVMGACITLDAQITNATAQTAPARLRAVKA